METAPSVIYSTLLHKQTKTMRQIFMLLITLTLMSCGGEPKYTFEQGYTSNMDGTFDIGYTIYQDGDRIHTGRYYMIPYDKTDSVLDDHYIRAKNHIDKCKKLDTKLKHERNKFK